jgi:hypothetical protein
MVSRVGSKIWILLKKIFSLTLILNSFITMACVSGILYGFFHAWPYWKPYAPYLISANLFLATVAAALINIFPSASIGRALHTGRLWFHHYVYGAFVLFTSALYVVVFTSVSLLSLFFINSSDLAVNTGRFFVLTGLTLFIDDLPDVSKRVESTLNKIKSAAYRARKAIFSLQLITGVVTFYTFLSIFLATDNHPHLTISNALTMGTLLITSITSFAFIARRSWLKITPASAK